VHSPGTPQGRLSLTETGDPLGDDDRRRRHARLRFRFQRHPDVLAFEQGSFPRAAAQLDRRRGGAHPGPGCERREHQPGSGRVERFRAEKPRDRVDRDP